jgi:hypothetical protein
LLISVSNFFFDPYNGYNRLQGIIRGYNKKKNNKKSS